MLSGFCHYQSKINPTASLTFSLLKNPPFLSLKHGKDFQLCQMIIGSYGISALEIKNWTKSEVNYLILNKSKQQYPPQNLLWGHLFFLFGSITYFTPG